MSISAAGIPMQKPPFRAAFKFAVREMRGGLRGFYIFLACIALGVMAISGVGSISNMLTDGIESQGRTIIGADVSFTLVQYQPTPEQLAYLAERGEVSEVATMRGMARRVDGADQSLIELKGVDNLYPFFGDLVLSDQSGPADRTAALAEQSGRFGVAVDPLLLDRLQLQIGDPLNIGSAEFDIRAVIDSEPDRLAGGINLAPRVLFSQEGLAQSGLIQPGSLVSFQYRVKLPNEAAAAALINDAKERFPDAGWRIRGKENAAPALQRNITRFAQFLTLVGLTALVVGGVGVANAVRAYIDSKRAVIATFKSVGSPGAFVFWVYLVQIAILAGIGIAIGAALGAIIPAVAVSALSGVVPLPTEVGVYPQPLLLGVVYGLLTSLVFALWPLGRAHDVSPTSLFRDSVANIGRWPRRRYLFALAVLVALLIGMAVGLSSVQEIAAYYVAGILGSFVLLRLVSLAIMWLARRAPRVRSTELRLAIGNIHRPGALTPSVVLSLGLGLALLVALSLIDGNLRQQLTGNLPEQAPNFFFIDIQNKDVGAFDELIETNAPGVSLDRVPMLRGRVVSVNGVPSEEMSVSPDVAWALRGDRGITYSADVPTNSSVVEGEWWPQDYQGPPLVSMEKEIADGFGLALGDPITVNILGRRITATLANTRELVWESIGINFVLVFSPNTLAGAPHSHLATATLDKETPDVAAVEKRLLNQVTQSFPAITSLRVKDALDTVNALVEQLAFAVRIASSVTLIASILVLAGALAAGQRQRVYDAVILKTLGATRRQLISAFGLEYLLLGLATAVFGALAGGLAAWFVLTTLMQIEFEFLLWPALSALAAALVLTLTFGLLGTWRSLGQKAAPVLRNL